MSPLAHLTTRKCNFTVDIRLLSVDSGFSIRHFYLNIHSTIQIVSITDGTYPKRNYPVSSIAIEWKMEIRFEVLRERAKKGKVKSRKMAVEIVSQYLFDGRVNKVLCLSFPFAFSYNILQYSGECVSLQCDVTFMNECESNGQKKLMK